MSPIILAVLVMLSVGAAGAVLVPIFTGGTRAEKRRKALQGDYQAARKVSSVNRTRETRRKTVQDAVKAQTRALDEKHKNVPLQIRIFRAGMKTRPRDFIRNSIILGVVIFALCFLMEVPILFALVFAVAGGYLIPRWYLKRRTRKFQKKFLDELPNAVEAIVRGVRSGLPLNDSMKIVASEVKEPVRSEFGRVLEQQSVGKSMTEAVQILFDRVPLPEVNFFVVVITVQQQAGGNLSEALGNLAHVLRNRKKMQGKIKAMSSEAKASAYIIGSLPFIVAFLVSLVTPNYLEPLYTTQIGMIWLGIATVLMGFGIFVMNRMIQIDF
jgi:tight adherence protein B